MDAALLMVREGVRSLGKKKLADGNEYELFYKVRLPEAVAEHLGAEKTLQDKGEKGDAAALLQIQKVRAKLIATAMCNEDGSTLMTIAQAAQVPITLKEELCRLILSGSNEIAESAGKD